MLIWGYRLSKYHALVNWAIGMLDIIHGEITRLILLRWDLPLGGGNLYEYMQASFTSSLSQRSPEVFWGYS